MSNELINIINEYLCLNMSNKLLNIIKRKFVFKYVK